MLSRQINEKSIIRWLINKWCYYPNTWRIRIQLLHKDRCTSEKKHSKWVIYIFIYYSDRKYVQALVKCSKLTYNSTYLTEHILTNFLLVERKILEAINYQWFIIVWSSVDSFKSFEKNLFTEHQQRIVRKFVLIMSLKIYRTSSKEEPVIYT